MRMSRPDETSPGEAFVANADAAKGVVTFGVGLTVVAVAGVGASLLDITRADPRQAVVELLGILAAAIVMTWSWVGLMACVLRRTTVTPDGVENLPAFPRLGWRPRRIAWGDVESVSWRPGSATLRSGRTSVVVLWAQFTPDMRGRARAYLRDALTPHFGVIEDPPPRHPESVSWRRLTLLLVPGVSATLAAFALVLNRPHLHQLFAVSLLALPFLVLFVICPYLVRNARHRLDVTYQRKAVVRGRALTRPARRPSPVYSPR